jgi:hypothetical protein
LRVAAALLPVLLAAWVYHPITHAYFFADDFNCLLSIVNDGFLRFVLRPFGGHNLLVRNLVFYGSYQLFGLHAELYFWTVLLTHLVNVWLLFRVLRRLTASLALACLGAALWGTSPVHVDTLGWYSVFGQVLVATILLVVLDRVTRHASTGTVPSAREAGVWYVLLLLGTTCFGTGIGVALAFPMALFLLVPAAWQRPGIRLAYLALPVVTIGMYFAFRRLYGLLEPLTFNEVIAGNFTLRRLWLGLPTLYELLGVSVDVSLRSFFFSPADHPTVVTLVTWTLVGTGLVVLVWRGDAATRRVVLAMLALAVGVYGMIAVGRPPVPGSGATRQWLAARPRYHYVGGIPIVVLIGLGLAALGRVAWLRTVPRAALVLGVFAVGVVGYLRSDFKIDDHAVCRNHLASMLRGIAAEVERGAPGATVYLENGNAPRELLGPIMVQAKPLFPARAAAFLLEHPVDEVDGRRVRFVERDPAVLRWFAQWPNTPLARLLVAPDALPR